MTAPDPTNPPAWPAGVDASRWLRGACSSGDPLFPAVTQVLAELAELRAAHSAALAAHEAWLARVTAERDELRAQRAAALALHPREEWSDDSLNGVRVVCGNCLDASEDPIPWPCPTAEALGATDA